MNSKFSDFFRNATYEEKERLWKEIARKACEEQLEVINQARQMNEKKYPKAEFRVGDIVMVSPSALGLDQVAHIKLIQTKVISARLCEILHEGSEKYQWFYSLEYYPRKELTASLFMPV